MSFDVGGDGGGGDRGEPRRQCILQLGTQTFDPVAGIVPQIAPAEQARADDRGRARRSAPAPRVIAILEPADGLGEGYITERVAGETLGARIVRDERFAAARRVMARQCGEILAAIHRIDLAEAPFPDAAGRRRTRRGASQASSITTASNCPRSISRSDGRRRTCRAISASPSCTAIFATEI